MEVAGWRDIKQLTSGYKHGDFQMKMQEMGVWSKIKKVNIYSIENILQLTKSRKRFDTFMYYSITITTKQ
jgi:Leu/Phe-tRNA-protein transferase